MEDSTAVKRNVVSRRAQAGSTVDEMQPILQTPPPSSANKAPQHHHLDQSNNGLLPNTPAKTTTLKNLALMNLPSFPQWNTSTTPNRPKQHLPRHRHDHDPHGKTKGKRFQVQIPTRMLLVLALVFLVAPLLVFFHKEVHIRDEDRYEGHFKNPETKMHHLNTEQVWNELREEQKQQQLRVSSSGGGDGVMEQADVPENQKAPDPDSAANDPELHTEQVKDPAPPDNDTEEQNHDDHKLGDEVPKDELNDPAANAAVDQEAQLNKDLLPSDQDPLDNTQGTDARDEQEAQLDSNDANHSNATFAQAEPMVHKSSDVVDDTGDHHDPEVEQIDPNSVDANALGQEENELGLA